jgi:hypothetical protein
MTTQHTTPTTPVNAWRRGFIPKPTLRGLALGIVLVFTAMLPAEYGFDPLGASRSVGLTGHAQAGQAGQAVNPVGGQPGGPPITPKPGGPLTPNEATYKIDAIEFFITPDQFVEYKFLLKTGATMVFNWKASAPVDVDFHTVPEGKPISASETFMRGKASTGQGTYRAPYPGLHGWFWKNTGKEPVTITLYAAGFFSEARMFSGDPVGEPMEVRDPDPPPTF